MSVLEAKAPAFSAEEAEGIAERFFGVHSRARALVSERDQNFHLRGKEGREYVLKISNPAEDPTVLDFQTRAKNRPRILGTRRISGDERSGLISVRFLEPSLGFEGSGTCRYETNWNGKEYHVVVRSGSDGLGQWQSERRNLHSDYRTHMGDPPERIVRVWFIAVAIFQRGNGACAYRNIRLRGGGEIRRGESNPRDIRHDRLRSRIPR